MLADLTANATNTTKYRMFQKALYSCIPNFAVANVTKTSTLKGIQTIHRSTP
jgi:hypothetical protein